MNYRFTLILVTVFSVLIGCRSINKTNDFSDSSQLSALQDSEHVLKLVNMIELIDVDLDNIPDENKDTLYTFSICLRSNDICTIAFRDAAGFPYFFEKKAIDISTLSQEEKQYLEKLKQRLSPLVEAKNRAHNKYVVKSAAFLFNGSLMAVGAAVGAAASGPLIPLVIITFAGANMTYYTLDYQSSLKVQDQKQFEFDRAATQLNPYSQQEMQQYSDLPVLLAQWDDLVHPTKVVDTQSQISVIEVAKDLGRFINNMRVKQGKGQIIVAVCYPTSEAEVPLCSKLPKEIEGISE